jgi:hypothetical protein
MFAQKHTKSWHGFLLLLGCGCEVLANFVAISVMFISNLFPFPPFFL